MEDIAWTSPPRRASNGSDSTTGQPPAKKEKSWPDSMQQEDDDAERTHMANYSSWQDDTVVPNEPGEKMSEEDTMMEDSQEHSPPTGPGPAQA